MNTQDFVSAIERYVRDAAAQDTIANLKSPPGRRVSEQMRNRSDWYNNLSPDEAKHVDDIVKVAAHAAVFGMLAVLDGARTIDEKNGRFELVYQSDKKVLINPQEVNLHDMLSLS